MLAIRALTNQRSAGGIWVSTVWGSVDPGELDFRRRVVAVVEIWKDVCTGDGAQFSPGAAGLVGSNEKTWPYPPRVVLYLRAPVNQRSAIGPWYWGFHTVRRGVDPGEFAFRPVVTGAVEIWKDICTGDGAQFSPGAAGLGGGQTKGRGPIPPGLCSLYTPQLISDRPVGIGVHTVRGGMDPGEIDFRPRVVGIAEIWKDV